MTDNGMENTLYSRRCTKDYRTAKLCPIGTNIAGHVYCIYKTFGNDDNCKILNHMTTELAVNLIDNLPDKIWENMNLEEVAALRLAKQIMNKYYEIVWMTDWEYEVDNSVHSSYYCSHCGYHTNHHIANWLDKYCPHCGGKAKEIYE